MTYCSDEVKITVTGSKYGIFDDTGRIILKAGPAETVNVMANPNTVVSLGVSLITAIVTDINGNPVTDETVTIEVTGTGTVSAVTNVGDGTYTATYTAPVVEADVVETITATATKANKSGTAPFNLVIEPPDETNAMNIEGVVFIEDGETHAPADFLDVYVVNKTKEMSAVGRVGAIYQIVFLNLSGIAASSNDIIEVTVKDIRGDVRGQVLHTLTKAEVEAKLATIDVTIDLKEITTTLAVAGTVFLQDGVTPAPRTLNVTVANTQTASPSRYILSKRTKSSGTILSVVIIDLIIN